MNTMVTKRCDNCEHEFICKYVEEMGRIQISVDSIDKSIKSPISIDIHCDCYKIKPQKHDSLLYRME